MRQQPLTTSRRTSPSRRPGFSLIEVLVVIGIIGILAALAVTGTFEYLETQKQSNTQTNMRAVYQVLQQHWSKVVADARKEVPSPAVLTLAGNDQDRATVIWIKLRLMEAFPMNFAEILSTDNAKAPLIKGNANAGKSPLYYTPTAANPYIPQTQWKYMPNYLKTLSQQLTLTGGNPPRASESIACLLLALQVNRSGAALNPDSLGPSVTDTDGDGMKEIVDGWGTPLAYYRFPTGVPTGSTELSTNYNPNPTARFKDPLDPQGRLLVWSWYNNTNPNYKLTFEALCHAIDPTPQNPGNQNPAQPPVLNGVYIVPVLVSAGRDTKLGMQTVKWSAPNPMALTVPTPVPPQDYDNIYSYRLRVGARGD